MQRDRRRTRLLRIGRFKYKEKERGEAESEAEARFVNGKQEIVTEKRERG